MALGTTTKLSGKLINHVFLHYNLLRVVKSASLLLPIILFVDLLIDLYKHVYIK